MPQQDPQAAELADRDVALDRTSRARSAARARPRSAMPRGVAVATIASRSARSAASALSDCSPWDVRPAAVPRRLAKSRERERASARSSSCSAGASFRKVDRQLVDVDAADDGVDVETGQPSVLLASSQRPRRGLDVELGRFLGLGVAGGARTPRGHRLAAGGDRLDSPIER